MKSMTGFGASQFTFKDGISKDTGLASEIEIEVTVKSLNGRFLEIRSHLPNQYVSLESDLRTLIQQYFSRGRIDLVVRRRHGSRNASHRAVVQTDLARLWIESYKKLGSELKLLAEPSLDMVARLPEVITFEENLDISGKEKKMVLVAVEKALTRCESERNREGAFLQKELLKIVDELSETASTIMALRKKANSDLKNTYQEKVQELGFSNIKDNPRFIQEIALLVEKHDIAEELTRLKEHLNVFKKLLSSNEVLGKKLDFYTQELLREINTIGSKSQVAKLTQAVVNAKGHVERLKEQVQNIE